MIAVRLMKEVIKRAISPGAWIAGSLTAAAYAIIIRKLAKRKK